MRVLLVEDDQANAEVIVNALAGDGHNCDVISSGEDYDPSLLRDDKYDLVILDIYLSGPIDGYDILLRIRNAKFKVPVMMLSAISNVGSKTKGFNFGADDYLTKPFHKAELISRVKAIVRRAKGHPEAAVHTGRLKVNFDTRHATVDDKPLQLTYKEYSILEFLSMRKGTVLTKEMFLNHLYSGPEEPKESKIVDVFVCKIRKKIACCTGGECYIETVWGRGYVLKDPEHRVTSDYDSTAGSVEHEEYDSCVTGGG